MRRFDRSLAFLAVALAASLPALAGEPAPAGGLQPASLPDSSVTLVDLMAADFFEHSLRLAQSRRIEAETARRYLALPAADRARFRAERRAEWRAMSEEQRDALRHAKTPRFSNLDEEQKQTFRRIATEKLGAADDYSAPVEGEL